MYSAKNCSLCEKAKEVINAVRQKKNFNFTVVDIYDSGVKDHLRFKFDIPVITANGKLLAKHTITAEEINSFLDSQ